MGRKKSGKCLVVWENMRTFAVQILYSYDWVQLIVFQFASCFVFHRFSVILEKLLMI